MHRKTGRYTEISEFWIWKLFPIEITGKPRNFGRYTVSGGHRNFFQKRKRKPWQAVDAGAWCAHSTRRRPRPPGRAAARPAPSAAAAAVVHPSGQGPTRRYMASIFSPWQQGCPCRLPATARLAPAAVRRSRYSAALCRVGGAMAARLVWEGTRQGSNFSGAHYEFCMVNPWNSVVLLVGGLEMALICFVWTHVL